MTRSSNQLIHQSSPYLLQHAHNPVKWFPWGDEALKKAQTEDRLIIVSVGYSACHWCHVMERESFEDEAVAKLMNDHYISIKVDREERPDIDNLYMQAAMIVTGRGGWPLNVVALPDGRPVYGGTYFPKTQWIQLLQYFAQGYQKQRDKLVKQAEQIADGIQQLEVVPKASSEKPISPEWHQKLLENWLPDLDLQWGGREGAPKFPMPSNWQYLLTILSYLPSEQTEQALTVTLDRMAWGGIYDHVGGGFARYSTDAQWHVPHFEKMLFDNAQLITLYAKAYRRFKSPEYERAVWQTIEFCNRELRHENGGYYCALDADSEGEEGKYYVFTFQEWEDILENASQPMARIYNITKAGNWEDGKNIPFRTAPLSQFASELNIDGPNFQRWIDEHLELLHTYRQKRIRPGLDDKILTAWNALMVEGLCEAYQAFEEESFLKDAERTFEFLQKAAFREDGSLWRNLKGTPSIPGFLDDHALVAWAALQLYEATFNQEYLTISQDIAKYILSEYLDVDSPFFFYTSRKQATLVTRQKELSDNVIPSSNSIMARVLFRLGSLLDKREWIERAEEMIAAMASQAKKQSHFHGNWNLLALDIAYPPAEIAIIGPNAKILRKELAKHDLGNSILLGSPGESELSLLKGKHVPGKTLIYVCRDKTCQQPVETTDEALTQLNP